MRVARWCPMSGVSVCCSLVSYVWQRRRTRGTRCECVLFVGVQCLLQLDEELSARYIAEGTWGWHAIHRMKLELPNSTRVSACVWLVLCV